MDKLAEKGLTWKLITVIVLCLLITAGFLLLLLSGKASFIPGLSPKPEETADTAVPETPTASTEPEETKTPEATETPSETEETETPETSAPADEKEEPDASATPEPTKEPEPTPETTPEPTPEATPDPRKDVDVYSDDSIQRIVNKEHLIPADYVPADLVVPQVARNSDMKLRKEAAEALEEMFAAAKEDGIYLNLASGYRSYGEQEYLYNYYLKNRGEEWTSHVDAYPGGSEHQTGLSVDLSTTDHVCEIYRCFGETDAFKWLQKHSWEYGYIERNPENTEEYTGIQYSPWNFRYVGKEQAKVLYESGKTMEEYYFGDN